MNWKLTLRWMGNHPILTVMLAIFVSWTILDLVAEILTAFIK